MRAGPKVRKERFAEPEPALAALRAHLEEAGAGSGAWPVSVLGREYDPQAQVAARGEIRAPGRRRAGADLRGDGSVEAWTGWLRRSVLQPERDETPWDALRREVAAG